MDEPEGWYQWTGVIIGSLAALITFIIVYIAAIGSVGWVFGIAVGWVPAGLAAAVAFGVLRWLWPLFVIGVVLLVSSIMRTWH